MPYKLTLVLTPKQAADVKYYTEQAARLLRDTRTASRMWLWCGSSDGRSMPGSGSPK